ncbi:hypothetical protein TNCV_690811 [Trichonephila clavipes]|nr:hypothetical protein TNCV_690811 [Trichonephila clavipes]
MEWKPKIGKMVTPVPIPRSDAPMGVTDPFRNMILTDYTKAFGKGPRNFEPWSTDEDDTRTRTTSPNPHHTNGRSFELYTDLTCTAPLHGGSLLVLGSNSWHDCHDAIP